MVRRSLRGRAGLARPDFVRFVVLALVVVAAAGIALSASACGRDRDMLETMEMPDSMPIMRAMESDSMRDALLDTMPGGEMVRGDSTAEMELLKDKM